MMRTATSGLGELLTTAKSGIKSVALGLSALVLPVGRPLVRKCLWQLNNQGQTRIEVVKNFVRIAIPVDASMLLTRAADATNMR
jgi:predicted cation transporter